MNVVGVYFWQKFLSHVLRNFIEDQSNSGTSPGRCAFLSHVLRNFIEEATMIRPTCATATNS